ncbi:MAG: carbonic anhydrase, partial [Proteobacteria bacterium]|nr:carbonic anhydrase [Pseudomonadota bacterium]
VGAKVIAVIGHTSCGAVKGAIDNAKLGSLTGLVAKIKPAQSKVAANVTPRSSTNSTFVDDVAAENVKMVMTQIRKRSPVIQEMLDKGQVKLVGGIYDLSTGKVEFFG